MAEQNETDVVEEVFPVGDASEETAVLDKVDARSDESAQNEGDASVDDGTAVLEEVEDSGADQTEAASSYKKPSAVKEAVKSIDTGALKKHKEVLQQIAAVKQRIANLQQELTETEQELERRETIEQNYDQIVAEQSSIRDVAQQTIEELTEYLAQLAEQAAPLEAQLQPMVEMHESQLMPFKSKVQEVEVERDASYRKLHSAQQALESVHSQITQCQKRYESAQQDFEAAAAKYRSISAQRDEIINNGGEVEASSLQIALSSAQAMQSQATSNMNAAQTAMQMAQSQLSTAEAEVRNSEVEARAQDEKLKVAQDAYDIEKAKRDKAERPLRDQLEPIWKEQKETEELRDDRARIRDEAIDMLNEAEDVHAHPEIIEQLASKKNKLQSMISDSLNELDELEKDEENAAAAAKKFKIAIGLGVAAVVILVVIIVAIVGFLGSCSSNVSAPSSSSPQNQPAQVPASSSASESSIVIDETMFPSAFVRNAILAQFDKNNDGVLSSSELAEAETLVMDLSGDVDVTTLSGLERLTHLKSLTVIGGERLSSVDLSAMRSLETAEFRSMPALELIKFDNANLKNLVLVDLPMLGDDGFNLNGCTSLENLILENLASLKNADLRPCANLKSLIVSDCPSLEVLDIRGIRDVEASVYDPTYQILTDGESDTRFVREYDGVSSIAQGGAEQRTAQGAMTRSGSGQGAPAQQGNTMQGAPAIEDTDEPVATITFDDATYGGDEE